MNLIQPSEYTFQEYYKMVNPSNKWHEDDAYSATVYSLNQYDWIKEFQTVENRFRVNGIDFEIRESKKDKREWSIFKRDSEGMPLRENGEIVYYSEEEKEKLFPEEKRYVYEHAVIESKTNKIVAMTQDEWGALLVTSAQEFKGFGLGQKLLNHHRKKFPVRDSGGHTPQGFQAVFKFYQEEVKNALINGEYRKKIAEGKLDTDKVKKIISSARLSQSTIKHYDEDYKYWILGDKTYNEKKKEKNNNKINLDMTDPRDMLLLVEGNYAILYNKKALDNIKNTDMEYFTERGLLGYVYIGGVLSADDIPKIHRVYGKNEKIENFMMEVAFNQFLEEPLRVYTEEDYLISDKLKESLVDMGTSIDGLHKTYQLNSKTNDLIQIMGIIEKKTREAIDPYDEKKILLQEYLYGISEDVENSRDIIKDVILRNIGDNHDTRRFALDIVRQIDIQALEKTKNQLVNFDADRRKEVLSTTFGIDSESNLEVMKERNKKRSKQKIKK